MGADPTKVACDPFYLHPGEGHPPKPAGRLQGDMDIIGTEGNQVLGRYNFSGAFETLQRVRERE